MRWVSERFSLPHSYSYSPRPLDIIVRKRNHSRVLEELARALLPGSPGLSCAEGDGLVIVRQLLVVRRDEVAALRLGDGREVLVERIGPDVCKLSQG
jgi:hypothetical protein